MGGTLTRSAYEVLIKEDIEWLLKQPRSLERDHIITVLKASPKNEYEDKHAIERLRDALREITEDARQRCTQSLPVRGGPLERAEEALETYGKGGDDDRAA